MSAATHHYNHAHAASGNTSPGGSMHHASTSTSCSIRRQSPVAASPSAMAPASPRLSSPSVDSTVRHATHPTDVASASPTRTSPSAQPAYDATSMSNHASTASGEQQQQQQQQHTQHSTSSAAPVARSAPPHIRLPTAAQRRRARELATVLLTLANCHACNKPVQDPVTLPCGHSSCLQCIKDRVLPTSIPPEDDVSPLPCLTHLPPRLPLSPMTVPCPSHGCPRSAIGRGIGVWAGHQPRYGLIPTYTERLPTGIEDVGPGAPPVDGFVMGVADHPLRLTVVGPQTRSRAHLFAVPPQGVEPSTSAAGAHAPSAANLLPSLATSNMLRTDVTLSKAVAILRRYASSPLPRPARRARPSASTASARGAGSSRYSRRSHPSLQPSGLSGVRSRVSQRRRSHTGRSSASTGPSSLRGRHAPSTSGGRRSHRSGPSYGGMGIFGGNESDLESGTVGGVQAAADSDDAEDSEAGDSDDSDAETSRDATFSARNVDQDDDDDGWTVHAATDEERTEEEDDRLWPDLVGGAFSRPPLAARATRKRGKAHLKRRRGRRSDDSTSSANSFRKAHASHGEGKVAKSESVALDEDLASHHADSGWSTEDSTVSDALNRGGSVEPLVDSVLRRRAAQLHPGASSSTEVDTDADGHDHRHHHHQHGIDAKHSLSLSSKTGLNGEPLIQTVATLHSELVEVLECQLCYLLLYDPLTTPCGHTFCKSCFARSLDHGDRCPLCRADMPNFSFFQDHRPNSALLKVLVSDTATFSDEDAMDSDSTQEAAYAGISIAMNADGDTKASSHLDRRAGYIIDDDPDTAPHHYGFKRLYEQRKLAIEHEEREARLSTPIFVCTLAFPGMPTILHIFEPRYRLMVRRCLESGNPRFGMVLPSRTNGGLEEYGTMLEIKSVQMLADGRSMLETVGSYRFRLLEKGSLDGYTVGRVERVDDISLEEEAALEAAVLRRRGELERKKAEEASQRPRAPAMAPSTSAPVRTQASRDSFNAASDSIRPDMARAESDAMAIYRTPASSAPGDGDREAAHDGGQDAGAATDDQGGDTNEEQDGLMPFKPVPAEPSIEELTEICTSFIETLRSGSAPWLLSRLNHTYGPMPSADEVERLGYWMALVMPIDEHEKAKLLPIRSRRLRLCLVVHWIEQLRQSWWFNSGCTVS